MTANHPDTNGSKENTPYKDRSSLDDIFIELGYKLLSDYDLGRYRSDGSLRVRPRQVRLILSKLRVSKPIIETIIKKMENKGLVKRNNQFLIIKKGACDL